MFIKSQFPEPEMDGAVGFEDLEDIAKKEKMLL